MENIIKVLIYVLMILQIIIGSVFIIGEVKSGEGKIKLYIIRELNLVTALIFFIISAENPHASLTETGYVILCIGETVIIIGNFFVSGIAAFQKGIEGFLNYMMRILKKRIGRRDMKR